MTGPQLGGILISISGLLIEIAGWKERETPLVVWGLGFVFGGAVLFLWH